MKNIFFAFIFCIKFFACGSPAVQQEEFSILGKWQNVSYSGNDGAKDYILPVKDGRIIIF